MLNKINYNQTKQFKPIIEQQRPMIFVWTPNLKRHILTPDPSYPQKYPITAHPQFNNRYNKF